MAVSIPHRYKQAKATTVSIPHEHERAKAMTVSIPHEHERAKAMTVSDKRPTWPTGPDCGTRGQYPLQTSSNQRDLHRLARTPVTNVVNLSQKTTIFSEKSLGLTTFVTTGQKATRKTPWIDDVCNNTHPSTPKTQHARPPRRPQEAAGLAAMPMGGGGTWPGFETMHRATSATTPHWCGGRRRARRARAGFEARRRTK